MKKIFFILALAIAGTLLSCSDDSSGETSTPMNGKWTIMIYLDGDNNLEDYAIGDLQEIEYGLNNYYQKGGLPDDINIIALVDRADGWSKEDGDWKDTRLYRIRPDLLREGKIVSERLDNGSGALNHIAPLGEKNMGDPETLKFFIDYSLKHTTSLYYSLILWNHGGGAKSVTSQSTTREICSDDTSNDVLFLQEIQNALTQTLNGRKLDVIGFDACLMGTIEVAYEFRNVAKYMVGSMHNEQSSGWDYYDILDKNQFATATGSSFAISAVKSYHDYITSVYANYGETLSAIDLSKMGDLKSNVDTLAVKLAVYTNSGRFDNSIDSTKLGNVEKERDKALRFFNVNDSNEVKGNPYIDLGHFCELLNSSADISDSNVKTAAVNAQNSLANAILYSFIDADTKESSSPKTNTAIYGDGATAKRGLSIFFNTQHIDIKDNKKTNLYDQILWYWPEARQLTTGTPSEAGSLDFLTHTEDRNVESWFELMEYWYGPGYKRSTKVY